MKYFLKQVTLFSIPVVLLFAFPFLVFVLSGELLPLQTVVNRQQGAATSSLYLSGVISSTDRPYKLLSTIARKPEIVIFGTSRTLTMRSDFFVNKDLFYNAGYNGGDSLRVGDLLTFINAIPEDGSIKVILLDVSSFTAEKTKGDSVGDTKYQVFHAFVSSAWRNLYMDYFHGKFSFIKLLQSFGTDTNVGIEARLYDRGYRKDGSLDRNIQDSPTILEKKVRQYLESELTFIVPHHGGLVDYSETLPQENIKVIEKFLLLCKKRNIYVVGYLSPYATELHKKMLSLPDEYGDSYRLAPVLFTQAFEKQGFHFYDIRNLATIGSSDSELYDSHHSTEKGMIKLLQFLVSREPAIKRYVNDEILRKQIPLQPF